MVNKCVAFRCKTGYNSSLEYIKVASFHFPLKNQQLLNYWIRFVNRSDWVPLPNSVLCEKHFNEKYIIRGIKCKLN